MFRRGAEQEIKTGRYIADGLWRGRLIEIKTGASFVAGDLNQLREFAQYAKANEYTLTYFFLTSPSPGVISKIEKAGGHVLSFF